MTDPTARLVVNFRGRVQGVGFRYSVLQLAEPLNINGYVRNELDGSVTVLAEGALSLVEDLHRKIRNSHLGGYITDTSLSREDPSDEFTDFRIEKS